MDCDKEDAGCDGGFMNTAFDYLKDSKLMTEKSYPYLGYDSQCEYDASKGVTNVLSYDLVGTNELSLKSAVAD